MSSRKSVHDRIHNLRGEQFRHLQNLRGSRSHLTSSNVHTVPSLPFRFLGLTDPTLNPVDYDQIPPSSQAKLGPTTELQSDGTSLKPPAGPKPPKSWRLNTREDRRETATWREEALSLVFGHLSRRGPNSTTTRIPSLSLLCLQLCLTKCTAAEFKDIISYVPPHLRRDFIRFTAIHSPLSTARLYTLWEPHGHAHGEILVVGPKACLKENHFAGSPDASDIESPGGDGQSYHPGEGESWDWDADDSDPPTPLTTLILINTTLFSHTLFRFPPTLTHLALICLSTLVPLHQLPDACPLLEVLDISYNTWLGANFAPHDGEDTMTGVAKLLDHTLRGTVALARVDWKRLDHLKVLGFRGNYVPEGFAQRVNEGKWDDVEIVF